MVFVPLPFTGICGAEACELRDNRAGLSDLGAQMVVITSHALPTNAEWARHNDFGFPVLSDHWPHGVVATAYGTFNPDLVVATRSSYVIDPKGVLRAVIATERLGTARQFDAFTAALAAI